VFLEVNVPYIELLNKQILTKGTSHLDLWQEGTKEDRPMVVKSTNKFYVKKAYRHENTCDVITIMMLSTNKDEAK
jgi:hypothetical protein